MHLVAGCDDCEVRDELSWPELPPPLPWRLYDGDAALQADTGVREGRAEVWFTVLHKPAIRYDFTSTSRDRPFGSIGSDVVPTLTVDGGVDTELVTCDEGERASGWNSDGIRTHGDTQDLRGGDGSQLNLLRFHLVNFGENAERAPRRIELDEWIMRINPTGVTPAPNGFEVTHVLDLVRPDHSTFSVEDTLATQDWLFDALTFASGGLVGFALAQGYLKGDPVFLEANCTKVDPWKTRRSWWDQRSLDDSGLAELCTRWKVAVSDARTGMVLRRAAGSYAAALTPAPLDIAVAVAGIGVELMVWELIHQRNQLLSTTEFDRLSFASRLRLALSTTGIPADLPGEYTALREYVPDAELADGPHAFGSVRNRLVHPPEKRRSWPPGNVMIEAWQLGVEYLALLVLAALGYERDFRSQLSWRTHSGAEVPVPWSGTRSRAPDMTPHA